MNSSNRLFDGGRGAAGSACEEVARENDKLDAAQVCRPPAGDAPAGDDDHDGRTAAAGRASTTISLPAPLPLGSSASSSTFTSPTVPPSGQRPPTPPAASSPLYSLDSETFVDMTSPSTPAYSHLSASAPVRRVEVIDSRLVDEIDAAVSALRAVGLADRHRQVAAPLSVPMQTLGGSSSRRRRSPRCSHPPGRRGRPPCSRPAPPVQPGRSVQIRAPAARIRRRVQAAVNHHRDVRAGGCRGRRPVLSGRAPPWTGWAGR